MVPVKYKNMLQRDQQIGKPTKKLSAWMRHGRAYGLPVWLVMVCAFAILTGSIKFYAYLTLEEALNDRDLATAQLQNLTQEVAIAQQQADIANQLPSRSDAAGITRKIQKQALEHTVSLSALNVQNHLASSQSLANTEWAVNLKGTYPNIKSTLAELLTVAPTLRIQSLKFSRSSAYEVEAQATLVEWLAPPPVSSTTK